MRNDALPLFRDLPRPAAEARRLVQLRFSVLPLLPKSKEPAVVGGLHAASSRRTMVRDHAKKHPDANYGVRLGDDHGVFVVDIDGPEGQRNWEKLIKHYGAPPPTVTTITSRGSHNYYRSGERRVRCSSHKLGSGIDVKGQGGYVVAAGSVHPSGHRYVYAEGCAPNEIEIAPAPAWLLDLVMQPRHRVEKPPVTAEAASHPPDTSRTKGYAAAALKAEIEKLGRAQEGQRNTALNTAAFSLGQLCGGHGLGEEPLRTRLTETALRIGLGATEAAKTIESGLRAGLLQPRNLRHLEAGSEEIGTKDVGSDHSVALDSVAADPFAEVLSALGQTDADNAHRFARRYCKEVAYAPGLGLLVWDGRIWEPAAETAALRRAEASARAIAHEAVYLNDAKAKDHRETFAQMSLSKGALERAVALARGHLEVPATAFDVQPDLLPVANGTLDLRTGKFGPHEPAHRLTRFTPVVYDPAARCPKFKRFLRRSLSDDAVYAFFQKAVGMTLTGDVGAQVLFFLLGAGRTGKSTVVNLIRELLGSFAVHTPVETFTTKTFETIRTDLARMGGARMVSAGEIHPSQQFDEALIKGMTGGDPITARFMRQDLIQYMPQFKIWLYANDAPKVRATDDAFWRRIRVVPFDNVVPENKVNEDLPNEMRGELSGILNWALKGCLAWRREGLEPPEAVRAATSEWRRGADHVARYLRERTTTVMEAKTGAADLHADFKAWCEKVGEQVASPATLKGRLTELGYVSRKTNKGRVWVGLKLRT